MTPGDIHGGGITVCTKLTSHSALATRNVNFWDLAGGVAIVIAGRWQGAAFTVAVRVIVIILSRSISFGIAYHALL